MGYQSMPIQTMPVGAMMPAVTRGSSPNQLPQSIVGTAGGYRWWQPAGWCRPAMPPAGGASPISQSAPSPITTSSPLGGFPQPFSVGGGIAPVTTTGGVVTPVATTGSVVTSTGAADPDGSVGGWGPSKTPTQEDLNVWAKVVAQEGACLPDLGQPTSVKEQIVSGINHEFGFRDGSTVTVYSQPWTGTLEVTATNLSKKPSTKKAKKAKKQKKAICPCCA